MHLRLRPYLKWSVAPLLVLAAAYFLFIPPRKVSRTTGPLHHQVYVWQRSQTPAVAASVRDSAKSFDAFVPLAAELTWKSGRSHVARVALDYLALKEAGKPIGLAIRVGTYAGSFASDESAARELSALTGSVLNDASNVNLQITELQIDFDCPESKLSGYQKWIELLRPICTSHNARLTLTALPSWLDRKAFASLAAAADGFVVQVHSFQPPGPNDRAPALCDPRAALDAVERAARLGRPFRVALPTYSYIACFDANGKVLGISAEGPRPQWPAGSRLQLIRSDESDIASLIRAWTIDRPNNLEGIIWYRLPVAGDSLNWRPQTLAAVMAGESPAPRLVVHNQRAEDGVTQLWLANEGNADAPVASIAVVVDAGVDAIVASDALGAFERYSAEGSGAVRFDASDALTLRPIAPGDSMVVGWVRTTEGTEVRGNVEKK